MLKAELHNRTSNYGYCPTKLKLELVDMQAHLGQLAKDGSLVKTTAPPNDGKAT